MTVDPLAEIVTLLRPTARFSKLVECAGPWRIHRQSTGEPFYCAVLEGRCRVTADGQPSMQLAAGDFVLVPAMRDLVIESLEMPAGPLDVTPTQVGEGHFRVGRQDGPADLRMRVGHCSFGSPDAALLVPLLPQVVLARGEPRLVTLMQLVHGETRAQRPARELVLERLLEVLLIEALRCGVGTTLSPGLSRGLADERLASALCAFHARPEYPWTVAELATEASLSRSALLLALQPHGGPATDGISPCLAHGAGQAAVTRARTRPRSGGAKSRLRLGQHLQHCLCPLRRRAAGPLWSDAHSRKYIDEAVGD